MKRDERKDDCVEKFLWTPKSQVNQPKCFEIIRPFGRIVLFFFRKFRILPFFLSINYMIRIRFFGLRESFQQGFRAAQYHSGRERLMTGLSRETGASGNFDAMFSCHDVFRFADPASDWISLLDGNKDYLHNQARSERTCETRTSSEISRQLYRRTSASSLCSKIGIGGRPSRIYWVSTRASKTTRRINFHGKSFRKTQIKNIHEMEKNTKLNNYELKNSQYKNWEKVMKQYRSSLHKYDKWRSKRILNYSGEFQEVESNYSEGLFYVSSQQAVPFDTWNTSGQQENVFGNQFSTVDSRNHYQGIHLFSTQSSTGPTKYYKFFLFLQNTCTGTHFQDMKT